MSTHKLWVHKYLNANWRTYSYIWDIGNPNWKKICTIGPTRPYIICILLKPIQNEMPTNFYIAEGRSFLYFYFLKTCSYLLIFIILNVYLQLDLKVETWTISKDWWKTLMLKMLYMNWGLYMLVVTWVEYDCRYSILQISVLFLIRF